MIYIYASHHKNKYLNLLVMIDYNRIIVAFTANCYCSVAKSMKSIIIGIILKNSILTVISFQENKNEIAFCFEHSAWNIEHARADERSRDKTWHRQMINCLISPVIQTNYYRSLVDLQQPIMNRFARCNRLPTLLESQLHKLISAVALQFFYVRTYLQGLKTQILYLVQTLRCKVWPGIFFTLHCG